MTEPNDLLEAVDALTKPVRTKVIQEILKGTELAGTKTVTVELPPLLEQLDNAIRGTIGIGGSGSLANERNMLNNDAFYKAVKITNLIRDWATLAKVPFKRDTPPGKVLRYWYVKFVANPASDELSRWHIGKMQSWAAQIETMFDPPKTADLPDACPVCGASTFWLDGQEYPRPLVLTYRDEADMIGKAKGMCRACETVWNARELAYALETTAQHADEAGA